MRVQMRAEIIKLHQLLKATMIYVTHDQVEAMTMGDRIVVMDAVVNPDTGLKEGVVQQIDTPLNLYIKPANLFVAGFLGSPPMNFIKGSLTRDRGRFFFKEAGSGPVCLDLGSRAAADAFAGAEVVLGIRPDDCNLWDGAQAPEGSCFEASIDIVEQMGAETYYYLQTGRHNLVSRSHPAPMPLQTGERASFKVRTESVHLFDPATSQRIG